MHGAREGACAYRLRTPIVVRGWIADRLRKHAAVRSPLRHSAFRSASADHERIGSAGSDGRGPSTCGRYSGGTVRRLEIAQNLLRRPEVLFLDEPAVGLDPAARDAVWTHVLERR